MLIEICFIDTQSDVELYKSLGDNRVADAIVRGLVGTTTSSYNPSSSNNQVSSSQANNHLRDFQRAYNKVYGKNILVDGLWGNQSLNAVNNTLLKQGSRNDLVAWVQIRIGKCAVDGIFGIGTKQAVIDYQRSNGLLADGIVGANTLKTILKQYGVKL